MEEIKSAADRPELSPGNTERHPGTKEHGLLSQRFRNHWSVLWLLTPHLKDLRNMPALQINGNKEKWSNTVETREKNIL